MDEKNNDRAVNGEFRGVTPIDESPGAKATPPIPPGIVPIRSGIAREFIVDQVMPIPCRRAPFVVWVEGIPYAGFERKTDAYDAMHAWRQRWPAAAGRTLMIKER